MTKEQAIKKMITAGWRRHDGTEFGENGKSTKGKQHKVSSRASLADVRSLNSWLRKQDEWWVAPCGAIKNWREFQP